MRSKSRDIAEQSPRFLTSSFAAGPPINAQNNDIWIATNVDTFNTRCVFQFNPSSTSPYKWECISGTSMIAQSPANVTNGSVLNTWLNLVASTILVARAGEYRVQGACSSNHPAVATNYLAIYIGSSSNLAGLSSATGFPVAGGYSAELVIPPQRVTIPAGFGVGLVGQSNTANANWLQMGWEVMPLRVS
jgi:hypothetical protein